YADNLKLKPAEADAVYAGIVMDTGNFESKAGVRTFEAAAYLRRCGTDVTRVRKLFRDTKEDYRLRTEILSKAQVYKEHYIIGICPKDPGNPDLTVIAAQAANELLRIRGVKASFVFTEYDRKIFLSARSIDEMNVQVVCEKLGGGGHMSIAGAQFTDCTVEEAVERLKTVLEEE
ncbi:MAG: DHH family phosphoesterase, partial [Lachnospiraceae bacterium]|nr:DHH family phosphoesterase [Lachnospiraceae bacterium]